MSMYSAIVLVLGDKIAVPLAGRCNPLFKHTLTCAIPSH